MVVDEEEANVEEVASVAEEAFDNAGSKSVKEQWDVAKTMNFGGRY